MSITRSPACRHARWQLSYLMWVDEPYASAEWGQIGHMTM